MLALADGDQRKIRPLGVNDVLSHLDAAQKKDKVSSWKVKDIKDSFNKTLLFIQTVSSITAAAASQYDFFWFNLWSGRIRANGREGVWPLRAMFQCAQLCDPSIAGLSRHF